jgi:hypothetical protein
MANTCDWILLAKCPSEEEAQALFYEMQKHLPGQQVYLSGPAIYTRDESGNAYLETDGECGWGLYACGMKEKLVELSKSGNIIEVFSDYATKFDKNGDVVSDTYQEHLIVSNGEVETYSFRKKIPRYGEYTI